MSTPFSDEWVSTYTPEVRDLAEAAMARGELGQCWLYAVPRAWVESNQDVPHQTIWNYPSGQLRGEPFFLKGTVASDKRALGDL